MSCMIAALHGGLPEIFPIPTADMNALETDGTRAMLAALRAENLIRTPNFPPHIQVHIGVALRPDGRAFYLTTSGPDLDTALESHWVGGFFSSFGIGDIVGTVEGHPGDRLLSTFSVKAQLRVEDEEHARAE